MENEQINFSFSEIQHSRPRKTSISSYTSYTSYTSNYFPKGSYYESSIKSKNTYNRNDNGSIDNIKQGLVSRRNSSEPQLSNIKNHITVIIPNVYPALLSNVATAFMKYVPVATYIKDSIKYTNCFRGSDAVETLKLIIRTSDRNLALLLGRALGNQNFFHDVTYNHFLRDHPNELYQFSNAITDLSIPAAINESLYNVKEEPLSENENSIQKKKEKVIEHAKKSKLIQYLMNNMCYSISCPRRLEQQNLLNHVARTTALAEKIMNKGNNDNSENQYWSTVMPKEIVESVSDTEKKRQEVIFELIKTEKEYIEDLELIQKLYVQKLRYSNILEEENRESFINRAFINISQIYSINNNLYQLLHTRQQQEPVVSRIGDIFLACIKDFECYIEYGYKQIYGKYVVETEKLKNPTFKYFLRECERYPKSRKLPIESFLARPTTRIGRYPLLIEAILKRTPENNPDYRDLNEVIRILKNILNQINEKAGKAQNNLKLNQLNYQLIFNSGEWYDLKLLAPERKLIREGSFNIKISGYETELYVFLFDHMLVLSKRKKNGLYKVYRAPIPLETLIINDKMINGRRSSSIFISKTNSDRNSISSLKSNSSANLNPQYQEANKFPLTIMQLGRSGEMYILYATSFSDRKAWKDAIEKQKAIVQEKMRIYNIVSMGSISSFTVSNRAICALPYNDRLVIGSDNGIYIGPADGNGDFEKILNLPKINQIDIFPDFEFFVVLSDKSVYVYSTALFNKNDSSSTVVENEKKLCSNITFFKVGLCLGRYLICCVKSSTTASTIRTFEYSHSSSQNRRLMKLLKTNSSKDRLRLYKEFYIQDECNSIYFLRSKICISGSKTFQVINLENLLTQDLLDFSDPSFEFMKRKDIITKPISIFRVMNDLYLLCFSNFALFIDRLGRRARTNKIIYWLGMPTVFTIQEQFLFAFEPEFVEIRSLETCEIVQIIPCHKLKNLNISSLHCVMESNSPYQIIFRLVSHNVSYSNQFVTNSKSPSLRSVSSYQSLTNYTTNKNSKNDDSNSIIISSNASIKSNLSNLGAPIHYCKESSQIISSSSVIADSYSRKIENTHSPLMYESHISMKSKPNSSPLINNIESNDSPRFIQFETPNVNTELENLINTQNETITFTANKEILVSPSELEKELKKDIEASLHSILTTPNMNLSVELLPETASEQNDYLKESINDDGNNIKEKGDNLDENDDLYFSRSYSNRLSNYSSTYSSTSSSSNSSFSSSNFNKNENEIEISNKEISLEKEENKLADEMENHLLIDNIKVSTLQPIKSNYSNNNFNINIKSNNPSLNEITFNNKSATPTPISVSSIKYKEEYNISLEQDINTPTINSSTSISRNDSIGTDKGMRTPTMNPSTTISRNSSIGTDKGMRTPTINPSSSISRNNSIGTDKGMRTPTINPSSSISRNNSIGTDVGIRTPTMSPLISISRNSSTGTNKKIHVIPKDSSLNITNLSLMKELPKIPSTAKSSNVHSMKEKTEKPVISTNSQQHKESKAEKIKNVFFSHKRRFSKSLNKKLSLLQLTKKEGSPIMETKKDIIVNPQKEVKQAINIDSLDIKSIYPQKEINQTSTNIKSINLQKEIKQDNVVTSPNIRELKPQKEVYQANNIPSLGIRSPSLNVRSPSLNVRSPSLNIGSPSLNIGSPSLNIGSPSLNNRQSTAMNALNSLLNESSDILSDTDIDTESLYSGYKSSALTEESSDISIVESALSDDQPLLELQQQFQKPNKHEQHEQLQQNYNQGYQKENPQQTYSDYKNHRKSSAILRYSISSLSSIDSDEDNNLSSEIVDITLNSTSFQTGLFNTASLKQNIMSEKQITNYSLTKGNAGLEFNDYPNNYISNGDKVQPFINETTSTVLFKKLDTKMDEYYQNQPNNQKPNFNINSLHDQQPTTPYIQVESPKSVKAELENSVSISTTITEINDDNKDNKYTKNEIHLKQQDHEQSNKSKSSQTSQIKQCDNTSNNNNSFEPISLSIDSNKLSLSLSSLNLAIKNSSTKREKSNSLSSEVQDNNESKISFSDSHQNHNELVLKTKPQPVIIPESSKQTSLALPVLPEISLSPVSSISLISQFEDIVKDPYLFELENPKDSILNSSSISTITNSIIHQEKNEIKKESSLTLKIEKKEQIIKNKGKEKNKEEESKEEEKEEEEEEKEKEKEKERRKYDFESNENINESESENESDNESTSSYVIPNLPDIPLPPTINTNINTNAVTQRYNLPDVVPTRPTSVSPLSPLSPTLQSLKETSPLNVYSFLDNSVYPTSFEKSPKLTNSSPKYTSSSPKFSNGSLKFSNGSPKLTSTSTSHLYKSQSMNSLSVSSKNRKSSFSSIQKFENSPTLSFKYQNF
ncbi:hypothetical protein LY90DRAFT_664375 [Neocallimastix californiae]|uniref:CNH-domain-containing protein n=1 Tax=Neocallimastix californiae TaxID=1754190 RepID=A0A1Y2FB64_9FUNG|nr:hypothetical protein LY90DRAFT_664375 [Neocallimastix californiae]|eukprot:ORY81158.1 hypothetical protein LY90DRAFT_664375 [Neocallimastix californiae]